MADFAVDVTRAVHELARLLASASASASASSTGAAAADLKNESVSVSSASVQEQMQKPRPEPELPTVEQNATRANFWITADWLSEIGSETRQGGGAPTPNPLPRAARTVLELAASLRSNSSADSISKEGLLVSLAELMLEPRFTMQVARLFRPLLPDIAARWLAEATKPVTVLPLEADIQQLTLTSGNSPSSSDGTGGESRAQAGRKRTRTEAAADWGNAGSPSSLAGSAVSRLERIVIALCRLLPNAPQMEGCATRIIIAEPGVGRLLAKIGEAAGSPALSLSEEVARAYTVRRLARMFFRLVQWSRGKPHMRSAQLQWSVSLMPLLTFPDDEARSYVGWTIAIINGLSEEQRKEFFVAQRIPLLPSATDVSSSMDIDSTSDRPSFSAHEILLNERDHDYQDQLALGEVGAFSRYLDGQASESGTVVVTSQDLSPLIVDACGVLLFRQGGTAALDPSDSGLVLTETTRRNVRALALAVSQRKPVLLEGPIGAGKTAVIEELAKMTGRDDLIKVHLGDQTDSKLLLGSYMTTAVPGEFRWQPGVLTQAVQSGRWILFEDVDRAPADVMTALLPLLEGRRLFVAERGEDIPAAESFQIFGTIRTGSSRSGSGKQQSSTNMRNQTGPWTRVTVTEPSDQEISQIIRERYQNLSPLWDTMLRCYFEVVVKVERGALLAGRSATLRDLIKWFDRTEATFVGGKSTPAEAPLLSLPTRQRLLGDALDCFVTMIPDVELRTRICAELGDILQADVAAPVEYTLPAMSQQGQQRPFARTRHAAALLEKLTRGVQHSEPLLLVGETGAGKTSVIQHLADKMGHKLSVINMSQQSDSSDLLGGFKPVETKTLLAPLKETFDQLFEQTFPLKSNAAFLTSFRKVYNKRKWDKVFAAFRNATDMATKALLRDRSQTTLSPSASIGNASVAPPSKKKRTGNLEDGEDGNVAGSLSLQEQWHHFSAQVDAMSRQYQKLQTGVMFAFVEGLLVRAVREGHWILLDEVNLASPETLESLSGLLQASHESLLLTEKGDIEPVRRHANFRLFGCMNPATDVGKRDLPAGMRSRFTEIYVDSPDRDRDDLAIVVEAYLKNVLGPDRSAVENVVDLYLEISALSGSRLYDGAGHRAHFTLRSLTRALSFAAHIAPVYSLRRALYEGFQLTFATALDAISQSLLDEALFRHLLSGIRNPQGYVNQVPKRPVIDGVSDFDLFQTFWIERGPHAQPVSEDAYIITPSVSAKLRNLARAVLNRKVPVLIQGPTSSGKTSMIEYLAKRTGHRFVRINNHEHTDIQEYVGGYVSDSEGGLVFQEGILVEAVRKGHWIVLDELNLAPTDVLEALNRLLDDNRELLIPETQEVVKPHPHFMLFATQNPSGIYGGRKALSRAFRNRFLEMHFDDIPRDELEQILEQRCKLPPSYCKKLVAVYRDLQDRRQNSRIFEGKDGYITLRDLFKWATREAVGYQQLAENGYMILAERVRNEDEKLVVKQALETEFRVRIDEDAIYAYGSEFMSNTAPGLVWTRAMRRLFALVSRCLENKEPVLLVGETGCGKTTVCEVLAAAQLKELHIINCQQHTETADFLGSQRPVRDRLQLRMSFATRLSSWLGSLPQSASIPENFILECSSDPDRAIDHFSQQKDSWGKLLPTLPDVTSAMLQELETLNELSARCRALFEWHDGPLVHAMKEGNFFLIDEISLAEDSVLERLNSVLETGRSLVLAEKGGTEVEGLLAHEGFRILATMNPGGDFGKKELSPALRNRFTEIWVPSVTARDDLLAIVGARFSGFSDLGGFPERMLDFLDWFQGELVRRTGTEKSAYSLRDVLAWSDFVVHLRERVGPEQSLLHGLCMVFLDGLQINPSLGLSGISSAEARDFRSDCIKQLGGKVSNFVDQQPAIFDAAPGKEASVSGNEFGIDPFYITMGPEPGHSLDFNMSVPTTRGNLLRILRAMQLKRPILLEGSPGVGKTSLVIQLSRLAGHKIVRINLSEQTDLMDLFGSDLPVEGGAPGQFAWRNGPLLTAMEEGSWVLLDELNLASQSVLEGLNSCLDHRSTAYVSELDRTFKCAAGFRIFAAQNPHNQGGGRKGLPRSFVNRFVPVYVDHLELEDLDIICKSLHPDVPAMWVEQMVRFNVAMHEATTVRRTFGHRGQPWDFNLRDVFRWLQLVRGANSIAQVCEAGCTIYRDRMRSEADKSAVTLLLATHFPDWEGGIASDKPRRLAVSESEVSIGRTVLMRQRRGETSQILRSATLEPLKGLVPTLESIMKAVAVGWMVLLVGPSGSGKTSLIRMLATMTGNKLSEFGLNTSVDTMELVGGFEQVDVRRHLQRIAADVSAIVDNMEDVGIRLQRDSKWLGDLQVVRIALRNIGQVTSSRDGMQTSCNSDSSSSELRSLIDRIVALENAIGGESSSHLQRALQDLATLDKLKDQPAGAFEWTDGTLVQAVEKGHWLLLDNANLCSPSVLDRLNSLLEPGGVLLINESGTIDGSVRTAKPHPDFRLFMTMDPSAGEVSRAMRNRGLEICLTGRECDSNSTDVLRLAHSIGLEGAVAGNALAGWLSEERLHSRDMRSLTLEARNQLELLQRGGKVNVAYSDSQSSDAASSLLGRFEKNVSVLGVVWPAVPDIALRLQDSICAAGMDCLAALSWLSRGPDFASDTSILTWAALCSAARLVLSGRQQVGIALVTRLLPSVDGETQVQTIWRLVEYLIRTSAPNHTVFSSALTRMRELQGYFYMQASEKEIEQGLIDMASVYQQSVLFLAGRLVAAQLEHPVVAAIAPLMLALQEFVEVSDSDGKQTLLALRDFLWKIIAKPSLDIDEITVLSGMLEKQVRAANASDGPSFSLPAALERATSALGSERYSVFRAFWETFHAKGLRSQESTALETALLDLAESFKPAVDAETLSNGEFRCGGRVDVDVKSAICEALASLYALDRSRFVVGSDLDWLQRGLPLLQAKISKSLQTSPASLALVDMWPLVDYVALRELCSILARVVFIEQAGPHDKDGLVKRINAYVSDKIANGSQHPAELARLLELSWSLDDQKGSDTLTPLLPSLFLDWQTLLWQGTFNAVDLRLITNRSAAKLGLSESLHGPAALRGSLITHLVSGFLSSVRLVPLTRLEEVEMVVGKIWHQLSTCDVSHDSARLLEMTMLWRLCCELLHCASASGDGDPVLLATLSNNLDRLRIKIMSAHQLDETLAVPEAIPLDGIRPRSTLLSAVTRTLDVISENLQLSDVQLGSLLAELSVEALRVIAPTSGAVDPAAQTLAECSMIEDALRSARALQEVKLVDDMLEGHACIDVVLPADEIADLEVRLDTLKKSLPFRPSKTVMSQMFKDLSSFSLELLGNRGASSRVETLCRSLADPSGLFDPVLLEEEQVIQDMLTSALSRLASYSDCRDVVLPVCEKIGWLKHGLRLLANEHRAKSTSSATLADRFLTYPYKTTIGLESPLALLRSVSATSESTPRGVICETLLSQVLVCAKLAPGAALQSAHTVFQTFADAQTREEEKLRKDAAEPTSIYRYRAEEDGDQNAVQQHFPSYAEELALVGTHQEDQPVSSKERVLNELPFDEESCWRMASLHADLVKLLFERKDGDSSGNNNGSALSLWETHERGVHAFLSWYGFNGSSLSSIEGIDAQAYAGLLLMMEKIGGLERGNATLNLACVSGPRVDRQMRPYNFYLDANVEASAAAIAPLSDLKNRINGLLELWRDHAVLLELNQICERVASFPISSPVMKFLTGFELLLRKCDEWESYASRDVSIKSQMERVTETIVQWRRHELQSWKELLRWEEHKCAVGSAKLWPHLYRNLLVAVDEAEMDLDGLVKTLDQFLLSATAGEFGYRMGTLRNFSMHLQLLAKSGLPGNLERVVHILESAVSYYHGLDVFVSAHIRQGRQPLEKELKDFSRVASWKDVNVYALQESATRTHHQLYKFVKRYREVLDVPATLLVQQWRKEPISGRATAERQAKSGLPASSLAAIAPVTNDSGLFERLGQRFPQVGGRRIAQAGKLSLRMRNITVDVRNNLSALLCAGGIDDLAVEIIQVAAQFAEEAKLAEGEGELVRRSNMKAVRRKALVDLLRRLQKLGISPRALPSGSGGIFSDSVLLAARPVSLDRLLGSTLWSDADRYFFETHFGISSLRDLMTRRSPDLTDSEASRCLNFVENLFVLLAEQRRELASLENHVEAIETICAGLLGNATDKATWLPRRTLDNMGTASWLLADVEGFTLQLMELSRKCPQRFGKLVGLWSPGEAPAMLSKYQSLLPKPGAPTFAGRVVSGDSYNLLPETVDIVKQFVRSMNDFARQDPDNGSLYQMLGQRVRPVLNDLETDLKLAHSVAAGGHSPSEDALVTTMDCVEALIESLLLCHQAALTSSRKDSAESVDIDEFGLTAGHISLAGTTFKSWAKSIGLAKIHESQENLQQSLSSLTNGADSAVCSDVALLLQSLGPLLTNHLLGVKAHVTELLTFHRNLGKLSHVLCRTFAGLFERGFCLPKEEPSSSAQDEEKGDAGAGLGEGQGDQDVSNEISNVDELDGGRDETGRQTSGEDDKTRDKGETKTKTKSDLNAEDDFGGDLEDVPEQGAQSDDDENKAADESDLEEKMGEVDGEGAQEVDDNLWNKEQDDEEDAGEGENGQEEEESRPQEDDQGQEVPASAKPDESEQQVPPQDRSEAIGDADEVPKDVEGEMRAGSETEPENEETKRDHGDTKEFSDSEEIGDAADDDLARSESGEAEEQEPNERDNDALPVDATDNGQDNDDVPENMDLDELPDDGVNEDEGGMHENDNFDSAEDIEAESKEDAGESSDKGKEEAAGIEASKQEEMMELDAPSAPVSGSSPAQVDAGTDGGAQRSGGTGGVQTGRSESADLPKQEQQPRAQKQMETPDPSRRLGDAQEAWRRRLNVLEGAPQTDEPLEQDETTTNDNENNLFEHIPIGQQTASHQQTLGAAGADEMEAVPQAVESERKEDDSKGAAEREEHVLNNPPAPEPAASDQERRLADDADQGPADELQKDTEMPDFNDGWHGRPVSAQVPQLEAAGPSQLEWNDNLDAAQPKSYQELRDEMDKAQVDEISFDHGLQDEARRRWVQYENRTGHLSAALAEQLRLILEPTLAAQLKGDYKSGKRLNMRKIIPYIASSFKKDKIWLRRTKPSKRQYQVMLAVDDSKSMSESRSVQLTYESLAIIAKALSTIEAGELAVVRFGEDVRLLHGFEAPFNTESGATVTRQFTFDQTKTDVRLLLQQSIGIFEAARESAGARGQTGALDLWQFLIIMSDGIYEDHGAVRSLIQQAAEKRVLVLFVVIDNRIEKDSVLAMTNVNYVYVDGKPTLSFSRYMDTFPAQYYVVLRNIEALPLVLSSALKQFFSASIGSA